MKRNVSPGGGLSRRALPLALALLLAACGGSGAEPPPRASETTTTAQPATTVPTSRAPSDDNTGTSPATSKAAAALFDAMAATQDAYRFESTVTVGDEVSTRVTGAVRDGAEMATVESGDTVVEYIKTADGEWVRGPDDGWIAVDEPVSTTEPLGALGAPREVTMTSGEGGVVKLRALYTGPKIGVPDEPTVTVFVTLRNGVVHRLRYEVPLGNGTVEVNTLISDVGDVAPIAAPEV